MSHWNVERWHFFALYGALIIINAVTAITESEIGVIGAYLIGLAMLFASAILFYHALKKKATTQGGSALSRWHFKWWHVFLLYSAALISGIIATLPALFVGDLLGGKLAIVLAMLIISAHLFYRVQNEERDGRGLIFSITQSGASND